MKKSGSMIAFLSSVLAAAPLVAISYLAWRRMGLPFLPFDLFDALSRILPGAVITRSIEGMIAVIRALNLGATAVVAKTAEQAIAVVVFFSVLVITGLLFLLIRGKAGVGTIPGFLLALLLIKPVADGKTASVEPAVGILWTFLLLILWGLVLGWLRRRLFPRVQTSGQSAGVEAIDRRRLLIRFGEASAILTVAGAVVGALPRSKRTESAGVALRRMRWSETHRLPNADAPVKAAPGTRPELTPLESHYRIDINTVPPAVKEADWKLRITGLVEQPISLSLEEIRKFDPMHQFVTIACISNLVAGDLIGTTRWTGVSMQRILQEIRPRPGATHLKIQSADGFFEIVALDTIHGDPRVMLAYEWDGLPLSADHGFPLRIYIPDRYGMKQPKWIESIELTDHPEEGYWVKRGWDAEARMRATSVIDTMSSNMMIAEGNGASTIPLGGIAHAGARGISRVQVKVDEEPWQDAKLRTPLSGTTWVIWRYDWPFKAGHHNFTVRCFEGNGTPQITAEAPPHPSGATGLHSLKTVL